MRPQRRSAGPAFHVHRLKIGQDGRCLKPIWLVQGVNRNLCGRPSIFRTLRLVEVPSR